MILWEDTKKSFLLNLLVVAGVAMVGLFIFFGLYLPAVTNHGESITVPDFTKKTLAELDKEIEDFDLRYEVIDSSYHSDFPPLSILAQYPKAGAQVKVQRKILLTIRTVKPPLVSLPSNVVGRSIDNAKMILQNIDLKITKVTLVSDPYPTVLKIKIGNKEYDKDAIKAGVQLHKGDEVEIIAGDGLGDQSLNMPNLIGKPLDEAEVLVRGLGLYIDKVSYVEAGDLQTGQVVKQTPSSGQSIQIGAFVSLWATGLLNETDKG